MKVKLAFLFWIRLIKNINMFYLGYAFYADYMERLSALRLRAVKIHITCKFSFWTRLLVSKKCNMTLASPFLRPKELSSPVEPNRNQPVSYDISIIALLIY